MTLPESFAYSVTNEIWVTFSKEGTHSYPAAAHLPELADVSFLGSPHRHIFHYKVTVPVNHNNRDIEFIQFKRYLEQNVPNPEGEVSCEMIAYSVGNLVMFKYPSVLEVKVSVSEDNENGALITIKRL